MAQKISFKQLGNDIIQFLGQCFINKSDITDYNQDITVNLTDLFMKDLTVPAESKISAISTINIVDNSMNLVGIAINKSFDSTAKTLIIEAIKYGEGKGKFNIYKSNKDLTTTVGSSIGMLMTDLDGTFVISDLELNSLVYDKDGTVASIDIIDIPNNTFTCKTLAVSGMPTAPEIKELVVKTGGTGYAQGDIVASTTSGVLAEVSQVDATGAIVQVISTTQTVVNTSGTGAQIDYDYRIHGAYGKNWTPLSNTAVQVAQIVSNQFTYETGYKYEITVPGTGYQSSDVITVGTHKAEVVKVNATGGIEAVRWSRNAVNTSGTGAVINAIPSADVFIIPDLVWKDSRQNSFDLTNDLGAHVEFNRFDGVIERCAAGEGSIYKFEFDSTNGVIYQEKTDINSDGGGIGPFVPYKNYKKDDVIINDNIIYICKDDHTAGATLGDDGVHWEEMRKQMTSGMRYVKTQIIAQSSSNTLRATQADYIEGDQSMYDATNCKYIAPVDGLYIMQVDSYTLPNNNSQRRETAIFKDVLNWNNTASCNSGVINLGISVFYTGFLKAGESLIPGHYSVTSGTIDVTRKAYVTFILLTDDRSDSLMAEATLTFSNQVAGISKIMKFTDSSNPSVISNDGIITLPEDGNYLLAQDQSLMTTTAADHTILTRILKGSVIIYDSQSTGAQSKYSDSYVFVLSGLKGDTFSVDNRTSIVLNNRTLANDPKIRLFKIKSVDYHIDSHDLYEDSGSTETYEDWVASKLKTEQLTVSATISLSNMIAKQFKASDLTYYSGETSMLLNNKLIAPVSGLYSIDVPVMGLATHVTGIQAVTSINKNDITSTDWTGCIQANQSYGNNLTNGISTLVWLNKDDYITIKFRCTSNNALVNTLSPGKVTMTLINSGLSTVQPYTSDKPHLWPANTEVDLGDGLYGYRLVRNVNVTKYSRYALSNPTDAIVETTINNQNSSIISQGGSVFRGSNWKIVWGVSVPDNDNSTYPVALYSTFALTTEGLLFDVLTNQTETVSVDAWVTYTK